jgi:hypothetical protein
MSSKAVFQFIQKKGATEIYLDNCLQAVVGQFFIDMKCTAEINLDVIVSKQLSQFSMKGTAEICLDIIVSKQLSGQFFI